MIMNNVRYIFVVLLFSATLGLSKSRFAEFPFGETTSISPDGSFTLQTEGCKHNPINCDRRVWVQNNRTHERKLLIELQRTGLIGWAPLGSAFFLNDDFGSNESSAYLYFPAENRNFDIGTLLDQKFPQDLRFEENSHHYVDGIRWVGKDAILVKRHGHFDQYVSGGNEFAICYLVNTQGEVSRLSETKNENSSCKAK
jgi:hypothetical protein